MNLPSLVLAISTMLSLGHQAVLFQKGTVCRQQAWLKGHELRTRALLHRPAPREQFFEPRCRLLVTRTHQQISWLRYPQLRTHDFTFSLRGKL